MTILLALYGFVLNRWRGHASRFKKYFPRPLPQIALAIPFAYVTPLSWGQPLCFWIAGAVLILTTLAWLTGHGRFFSLDAPLTGKPETLEFLIKWLIPYVPAYWYKALGLALTGIAVTLPAGIACLNPILALSGVLKAPAYMFGWMVQGWARRAGKIKRRVSWNGTETYEAISFLPRHLDGANEIGEALTGLFLLGALGILAA